MTVRIAVCVKQSLDTSVPLRVVEGVVRQEAPRAIVELGPADRAALEAALVLRAPLGADVTALSVGEAEATAALRHCLARGVERAVRVCRPDRLDPVGSARAAARILVDRADLVLCGRASADGASGLFPAALAAELGWPLVGDVAAIVPEGSGRLRVERRIARGDREVVRCPLPAVLAAAPGLAAPGYVALRALCRAERLPIEEVAGGDVAGGGLELLAIEPAKPRPRRGSGPDAKASAMDRLGHLLSGGVQKKRSGGVVEGSPATVAAEILSFLEEKGFLGPLSRGSHG